MYHSEYGRALNLLKNLHKNYQKTINPEEKDVRLAGYYLSGGALTEAIFSLKAWGLGNLNTLYRSKRFIDEAKELIVSLIVIKDRERFLKRFFKDEIVSISLEKYKKEHMETLGLNEAEFVEWARARGSLNHGFSKGVHPNFRSVAYNSDRITGEYNYDAENCAYMNVPGFDFAHFIIIPTIDAVTLPAGLYGINKAQTKEVLDLREKIQNIALQSIKERRKTK